MPISSPYAVFRADDQSWPRDPDPWPDPVASVANRARTFRSDGAGRPSRPKASQPRISRSRAGRRPCPSNLLQGELFALESPLT
jgi:hypothetical protein